MLRALLVFIALFTQSANAYADCAGSRLHDRFGGAATVFVADVLDTTTNGDVSFDIREAFKNARPGLVTLTFGFRSSESYWFRSGERVLVYAWLQEGVLTTTCSGTRRVTENDSDLTILRHLARGDAQQILEVPPFIISAKEHPLIADPDD